MYCLFECLLLFVCIKIPLRCCILSDPLVLSFFFAFLSSSTSSNYIDLLPILFSVFHNNPLNILIVLIPLVLNIYQKCQTIFCLMVCCAKIHTCRRWLWIISCIMSRFFTVVTSYWSSTSSKSSSSMASSYEASYISLIFFTRCTILWCLVVLQLCIIIL
jgi:hypothetical protein